MGIFIITGTVIFIGALYFLGQRQNLFHSSVRIHAFFHNVSGLQVGNNVQFSGINIGTVRDLHIVDDSNVRVTMAVSKNVAPFIKKDSRASISSEGLMGNRILVIAPGSSGKPPVADQDTIQSTEPVAMEELLDTFLETGKHAKNITANLEEITGMIRRGEGALGMLVADTGFENRLNRTFISLENSGERLYSITNDFQRISAMTSRGEGTLGKLLVDESIADGFAEVLDSLKYVGGRSAEASDNLLEFSEKLNNPKGPLGRLLTDTTMAERLDETLIHANNSAKEVESFMDSVKGSRFMRFFFGTGKE